MSHADRVSLIAVIGLGKLGLLHLGIFQALAGSNVVAIVESSAMVRGVLSQMFPAIHVYPDTESLYRNQHIDGVVIATPPATHVPLAIEALDHNIPFFVEKPLCRFSSEALPLVEAIASNPITHLVGFMTRFVDVFDHARTLVRSGALGKLHSLRATMYISQLFKAGSGWRYSKKESGGGVLITQNSHLLDLLVWIFGPVNGVSAHVQSIYSREVEDQSHAYLYFDSGLQGFIDTSWSKRHHRTLTLAVNVEGENGTLSVNDDEVSYYLEAEACGYPAGWTIKQKPDLFSGVHFDVAGSQYTRQAQYFLDGLRHEAQEDHRGATVATSFHVQKIIDAVYVSAEGKGVYCLIG